MAEIQINGIQTGNDIKLMNRLNPDRIGFVFIKDDDRFITREKARQLGKHLDRGIETVGIFKDDHFKMIAKMFQRRTINTIQLDGGEDEQYIEKLEKAAGRKSRIRKSFIIEDSMDIYINVLSVADEIIFDFATYDEDKISWSELKHRPNRAFFMKYGSDIDADKVMDFLNKYKPRGIEILLGELDYAGEAQLEAFVQAVKSVRTIDDSESDDKDRMIDEGAMSDII